MRAFLAAASMTAVLLGSPACAQSLAPTPPPPAPANAQPRDLLPALIEHSRHVARIENGRLVGEGADFLRGLGARSHAVMIGEDHGNSGIAHFSEALWRDLADAGFNYAAIETDPWVAEAAVREIRAGGPSAWGRFVASRGGAMAAPFLTWAPEVDLVATVLQTSRARRAPAIWGLDQTFIGAAAWQLDEIAANARDPEARALAARLAGEARANIQWLGQSEAAPLQELRAHLSARRDARWAALVDAMLASQAIYRPFTDGPGEATLANLARERMMQRGFLAHWRAAREADGQFPRVMLKFGAYHIYNGPTPTHVPGLGGFVANVLRAEGLETLSIMTVCGPSSSLASFQGPPESCDQGFAQTWPILAPTTERNALTIYDLRVWRLRGRRWEHLSADLQRVIESFDVLVVVPDAPASPWLEGLAQPHAPN
ncbi:MAG: hypothetical protein AB7J28_13640 [Hyphomonadaceae bacterium]